MSVFVDTSAFLAVMDADERNHRSAKMLWHRLLSSGESLVSTNYVLLETSAVIQHRFGFGAAREFEGAVVPILSVQWVGEEVHRAAVNSLLVSARRKLGLVDCVSFEVMRRLGIQKVFAFDPHFKEQGFTVVP
jgi:predicted nucleic acid-binding protein